ncbi:MAG: 16S rRNA (cytosine(1402)-N(4))-methyltransferase [Candidatus Marinimicrobia bacterium]|nr:16S rRNA (cytosine(1402)-N(4))-methyltransferase [Candidatus Neomarinimicrobiota bacterium]
MKSPLHIPVLKNEVINHLKIKPEGIYLDCTLGAGGHAEEILKKLNSSGLLIGLDADETTLKPTHTRFSVFKNSQFSLHHANFLHFPDILNKLNIKKVNGMILDLGLSSMELDQKDRGFSFQNIGPLDMRFNKKNSQTASELLNNISLIDLKKVVKLYGEEKNYSKIAQSIKQYVKKDKMKTTLDLKQAILAVIPIKKSNKTLARVFQSIRIAVNDELNILSKTLVNITNFLKKNGRVVIISYHSLEDRIVKQFFLKHSKVCVCPREIPICVCKKDPTFRLISRKPILPNDVEVLSNRKSRSAKMRVVEKT